MPIAFIPHPNNTNGMLPVWIEPVVAAPPMQYSYHEHKPLSTCAKVAGALGLLAIATGIPTAVVGGQKDPMNYALFGGGMGLVVGGAASIMLSLFTMC